MTLCETNNLRSQRWLGNGPYSFPQRVVAQRDCRRRPICLEFRGGAASL